MDSNALCATSLAMWSIRLNTCKRRLADAQRDLSQVDLLADSSLPDRAKGLLLEQYYQKLCIPVCPDSYGILQCRVDHYEWRVAEARKNIAAVKALQASDLPDSLKVQLVDRAPF